MKKNSRIKKLWRMWVFNTSISLNAMKLTSIRITHRKCFSRQGTEKKRNLQAKKMRGMRKLSATFWPIYSEPQAKRVWKVSRFNYKALGRVIRQAKHFCDAAFFQRARERAMMIDSSLHGSFSLRCVRSYSASSRFADERCIIHPLRQSPPTREKT